MDATEVENQSELSAGSGFRYFNDDSIGVTPPVVNIGMSEVNFTHYQKYNDPCDSYSEITMGIQDESPHLLDEPAVDHTKKYNIARHFPFSLYLLRKVLTLLHRKKITKTSTTRKAATLGAGLHSYDLEAPSAILAFLKSLREPLGHLAPVFTKHGVDSEDALDFLCVFPSEDNWDSLKRDIIEEGSTAEWLMVREGLAKRERWLDSRAGPHITDIL